MCRCLWKRSLAKDPRQMESKTGRKGDENTSNRYLEGRRTTWLWHELGANKSTDEKLHNAVLKTLCVLSQQVREVRGAVFMCWMIKQEAAEYKKPKEQLRAYSELAATKGKGHGLGPPGTAVFTCLLQALSEKDSTVGAANAAGVANLKQTWDDMEPEGAFDLVPHCKLAKVYDTALSRLELVICVAQHREHIRGALGQTGANRLLGQAPSGGLERALSAAIEQN